MKLCRFAVKLRKFDSGYIYLPLYSMRVLAARIYIIQCHSNHKSVNHIWRVNQVSVFVALYKTLKECVNSFYGSVVKFCERWQLVSTCRFSDFDSLNLLLFCHECYATHYRFNNQIMSWSKFRNLFRVTCLTCFEGKIIFSCLYCLLMELLRNVA